MLRIEVDNLQQDTESSHEVTNRVLSQRREAKMHSLRVKALSSWFYENLFVLDHCASLQKELKQVIEANAKLNKLRMDFFHSSAFQSLIFEPASFVDSTLIAPGHQNSILSKLDAACASAKNALAKCIEVLMIDDFRLRYEKFFLPAYPASQDLMQTTLASVHALKQLLLEEPLVLIRHQQAFAGLSSISDNLQVIEQSAPQLELIVELDSILLPALRSFIQAAANLPESIKTDADFLNQIRTRSSLRLAFEKLGQFAKLIQEDYILNARHQAKSLQLHLLSFYLRRFILHRIMLHHPDYISLNAEQQKKTRAGNYLSLSPPLQKAIAKLEKTDREFSMTQQSFKDKLQDLEGIEATHLDMVTRSVESNLGAQIDWIKTIMSRSEPEAQHLVQKALPIESLMVAPSQSPLFSPRNSQTIARYRLVNTNSPTQALAQTDRSIDNIEDLLGQLALGHEPQPNPDNPKGPLILKTDKGDTHTWPSAVSYSPRALKRP